MVSESLTNGLIFLAMFIIFLPYLAKSVRLATRTWEQRDILPQEQVRKIVFLVPLSILFAFVIFYLIVIFLIDVFVF
ncbi:MAG: hypothetical protein INQ03_17570 [Candidatus Heimdallarchaeota archaeon]|nr:hypothetical protein [Candidatus Heimdallarchaeota archaeon]